MRPSAGLKASSWGKVPVAGGRALQGLHAPGQLDLRPDRSLRSRTLWADTLQGYRSSHRNARLCADRDGQHSGRSRLLFSHPQGGYSKSDAVCGRGKHRRCAIYPRHRVPRKLQSECHRLGARPSTIRHVVLVAGVSELGLFPLLGKVRSRFFTRNYHKLRLARIRVVARVPSLDFHHSQGCFGAGNNRGRSRNYHR